MATVGDITDSAISSWTFDATAGTTPSVPLNISGTVYVLAYAGLDGIGILRTFSVDADGTIASIASWQYATRGYNPSLVYVSGTTYALVFRGPDNDGWLYTITINTAGAITEAAIATLEFDAQSGQDPMIVQVGSGSIFAIVWRNSSTNKTTLKTVGITALGAITAKDSAEVAAAGVAPRISHVSGDIYCVAYTNVVKSYSLDSTTGAITYVAALAWSTTSQGSHWLHKLATGYLVICYRDGNPYQGKFYTFSCSAAGVLAVIDTGTFDGGTDYFPFIGTSRNDVRVLVHQSTGENGHVRTWEISDVGVIGSSIDSWEFDTGTCTYPNIILITNCIYLITYSGDGLGKMFTLAIETPIGVMSPSDESIRVTNLIHRYNRALGIYTLEMNLGEVTSDFGLPQWLTVPISAIPEKPPPPEYVEPTGPSIRIPETVPWPEEVEGDFPYTPPTPQPRPPEPTPPSYWGAGPVGDIPGITEYMRKKRLEEEAARVAGSPSLWSKITPWKEEKGETFLSALMKSLTLFRRTK